MLIGRKLGMTRIFTEGGESVPVTVIKASPCFVLDRRTDERDGYRAYIMGFGEKKEKRVRKPVLGLCKKAGIPPVEIIREFRVADTSTFEVGEKIPVSLLQKGDRIDVVGWSKGRGFQGVVKRWGFAGGPGSHGSRFHRAPGTAGAGTYPGRVLKGKKFPGRMGNDRVTAKNLEVITLDEEKGLVVVKGSIPGCRNGFVLIKIGENIDVSARKELAKEQAEKSKVQAKQEKIEEKAEETKEVVEEEKKTEEKAKEKADKGEGKKAGTKEKSKKSEEKEVKAEKTEKKTEEVKEAVEKTQKSTEKKVEETAEKKEEKKEEKTEEKAEEKETDEVKSESGEEQKVEEVKEEEKEETKTEEASGEDEEVKNEEGKEEDKEQSKEKGDS